MHEYKKPTPDDIAAKIREAWEWTIGATTAARRLGSTPGAFVEPIAVELQPGVISRALSKAYEMGHYYGSVDAQRASEGERVSLAIDRFDTLMRRAVGILSDIQKQDSEIASILNDYSKVTARQATTEIGPTPRIERCPTHRRIIVGASAGGPGRDNLWNTGKVDRCLLVDGHGGEHRWPA